MSRSRCCSGATDEPALGHARSLLGVPVPALRRGKDPLLAYHELFDGLDDRQPEVFRRLGDRIALRFPDPEQRTDAAGRLIPHEFVLSGKEADGVNSLSEGRDRIWPLVTAEYAEVWEAAEPPAVRE